MTKKRTKYLSGLMAAIILIVALVVPASAASCIEEQMAANSAAWWVAHNAGDTATCEALHQANVALANQAAGSSGSATYNSSAGTWDITTDSGSRITSSGSYNGGKSNNITYTTTTSSGGVSATSNSTYTSSAINAYKNYGGTNQGLETSYNNAAAKVTSSGNYGTDIAQTTADEEVAVVQELLGLTNAEAKQLQADLETHKQEYESAQAAYQAAVASGDTEAAAAAKEQMNAAHEAAEEVRAEYNYTGDTADVEDGGYYDDWGNPSPVITGGGGFYIIESCKITASCNEGGTITPNGVSNVRKYTNQAYTIKANEGYFIQSVKIDNVDKGKLETYTFERVTTNHTITVTFAPKELAISASAGTGGKISPAGNTSVSYGDDKTFTITPNTGYKIESVIVDGVNKGAVGSYTFNDVTKAHTISATFVPSGKVDIGKPDVTDSTGGDVNGGSDDGSIKSGYGIFAEVPVTYNDVTELKVVMTYHFGSGTKTIVLEETSKGTFEYPVNAESPLNKRCVYIPVETADGTYTLTFTVTAKNAAGELLTDTQTGTVVVKGNMYEDDFTGDS